MKYQIFTTTSKAWKAMLSDIATARKSVYLEMFILSDDIYGQDFSTALINAARRGVKVILILDVIGSYSLNNEFIEQLKSADVEVLFYSLFFRRNHRKILVVDDTVAYVGGINISESFQSWKDLQIRFTFPNVVRSVVRSFVRVYRECGGKDQVIVSAARDSLIKRTKMWFVERGVGRFRYQLQRNYEKHIDDAKKSLIIVTPYLFPPRWLIARIHQAILRGVTVEILVPLRADYWFVNKLNKVYTSFFEGLGAHCYFLEEMNHAKAMLIDGRNGVIGSQNLDVLSFGWNIEAGVFFEDKDVVNELSGIITEWKNSSVQFGSVGLKASWYYRFAAFLLRLLGFIPLWL
jgi:cardiolipin synthase A/B